MPSWPDDGLADLDPDAVHRFTQRGIVGGQRRGKVGHRVFLSGRAAACTASSRWRRRASSATRSASPRGMSSMRMPRTAPRSSPVRAAAASAISAAVAAVPRPSERPMRPRAGMRSWSAAWSASRDCGVEPRATLGRLCDAHRHRKPFADERAEPPAAPQRGRDARDEEQHDRGADPRGSELAERRVGVRRCRCR